MGANISKGKSREGEAFSENGKTEEAQPSIATTAPPVAAPEHPVAASEPPITAFKLPADACIEEAERFLPTTENPFVESVTLRESAEQPNNREAALIGITTCAPTRRKGKRKKVTKRSTRTPDSSVSGNDSGDSTDSGPPRKKSRCSVCGHSCCAKRRRQRTATEPRSSRRGGKSRRGRRKSRSARRIRFAPGRPRIINRGASSADSDEERQAEAGSSATPSQSPLYVSGPHKTAGVPYTLVTPQMILEAIQQSGKLRAAVTTKEIAIYIGTKYAVNPDGEAFIAELRDKLETAFRAGLIAKVKTDLWTSEEDRLREGLSTTGIELFWVIYQEERLRTKERPSKTSLLSHDFWDTNTPPRPRPVRRCSPDRPFAEDLLPTPGPDPPLPRDSDYT